MLAIVDYRMGNLRSVQKAFERLGAEARIVSRPEELRRASKLVLPGVGAFADGMANLRELGLIDPIREFLKTGKPMLGICVGMQVLFDDSQEDSPNQGLGIVPGHVVRFHEDQGPNQPRLKVPHMGWNQIDFEPSGSPDEKRRALRLFAGIETGSSVYFVHGYHCVPDDSSLCVARTAYGSRFCAAVQRENLWATQFHPEKSQQVGLRILDNFRLLEG